MLDRNDDLERHVAPKEDPFDRVLLARPGPHEDLVGTQALEAGELPEASGSGAGLRAAAPPPIDKPITAAAAAIPTTRRAIASPKAHYPGKSIGPPAGPVKPRAETEGCRGATVRAAAGRAVRILAALDRWKRAPSAS